MTLSPKIFYIMAGVVAFLAGVLAYFDHTSFVAGLFVGIGVITSITFAAIGLVRQKLEVQMEAAQAQIGEMMGVDIEQLLSAPNKNTKEKEVN